MSKQTLTFVAWLVLSTDLAVSHDRLYTYTIIGTPPHTLLLIPLYPFGSLRTPLEKLLLETAVWIITPLLTGCLSCLCVPYSSKLDLNAWSMLPRSLWRLYWGPGHFRIGKGYADAISLLDFQVPEGLRSRNSCPQLRSQSPGRTLILQPAKPKAAKSKFPARTSYQ